MAWQSGIALHAGLDAGGDDSDKMEEGRTLREAAIARPAGASRPYPVDVDLTGPARLLPDLPALQGLRDAARDA